MGAPRPNSEAASTPTPTGREFVFVVCLPAEHLESPESGFDLLADPRAMAGIRCRSSVRSRAGCRVYGVCRVCDVWRRCASAVGWPLLTRDYPAIGDRDTLRLPFHPLELGEEALRALFGFVLEGAPRDGDLDPFEVPLLGFHPR